MFAWIKNYKKKMSGEGYGELVKGWETLFKSHGILYYLARVRILQRILLILEWQKTYKIRSCNESLVY